MYSLFHEAPSAHVEPAGLPSRLTRTYDVLKPVAAAAAEPDGEDRARPEERTTGDKSGSRSRSADPHPGGRTASRISAMIQNFPPGSKEKKAAEEDGSIPKISEYRSQFAWPRLVRPKPVLATVFSPVHQAPENDAVDGIAEDVPLLAENNNESGDERNNVVVKKTEYKSKFRPFNSYIYIDGSWKKPSKENKVEIEATNPWYAEVVERLKKADEYRWRSHGGHPLCGEQLPLIYSKPPDGWNQTRERSNLSELLIAQQQHQPSRREEKLPPPKEKAKRTPSAAPLSRRREHEGSHSTAAEKKKAHEAKPPRPKSADPTLGSSSSSSRKSPRPPKPHHYTPRSKHPVAVINSPDVRPHVAFKPVKSSMDSPRSRHPEGSKVWLKPQHKAAPPPVATDGKPSLPDEVPLVNGTVEPGDSTATDEDDDKKDVSRPTTLPSVNGMDAKSPPPPPPAAELPEKELAEIPSGPVPLTTVRSPEEVTGVKSPDPETWTVPLETGKGLEWTDGQTPDASRATSPPVLPPPPAAPPRTDLPVGPASASAAPFVPKPAIPPPPPPGVPAKPPDLPPVDVVSSRSLASDVLDRARSRLDQFWSKNK